MIDIEKMREVAPNSGEAQLRRFVAMLCTELADARECCDELRGALTDLVAECREAIKSEEWDGDNAAYQAALRVLNPADYE